MQLFGSAEGAAIAERWMAPGFLTLALGSKATEGAVEGTDFAESLFDFSGAAEAAGAAAMKLQAAAGISFGLS
jgi:hypothetical protein